MTTAIARRLRREMTDAERRLWARLRNRQLGVKFRRQMPINRFVADFGCEQAKVVIELDGGQHAIAVRQDRERTVAVEAAGYLVLRFWNTDVLENTDGVLAEIARTLSARSVHSA